MRQAFQIICYVLCSIILFAWMLVNRRDAAAPESWALTGRKWDINYSENRVSDKRLSTEEPGAQVLPAPAA